MIDAHAIMSGHVASACRRSHPTLKKTSMDSMVQEEKVTVTAKLETEAQQLRVEGDMVKNVHRGNQGRTPNDEETTVDAPLQRQPT